MGFALCYRCLQRRNTKAKPAIKRKIKTVNNKKAEKRQMVTACFFVLIKLTKILCRIDFSGVL